ncbi:MAG: methyltransferase domain-containing protein [Acidobacteria bacterium]|jgi:ubiquinone/menaquinone biosynthesis C-methylase UbiE|nr:methyltransferase domain-containing protein [Acidobacteriota bacterium]
MQTQLQTKQNTRTYPHNLLPSLRAIEFVCPLCRGQLDAVADSYQCPACQKKYPLHDGIPDFRVFPCPFLNYEEDRVRTEIVLAALEKLKLEKLLEHYWSFSDITPEDLRAKFIRSVRLGEEKARRTLEMFENGMFKKPVRAKKVLEIGAGTGNFLAPAAERFEQVVGIDIAMRWLHVSRRRFMEMGIPVPPLVCCCAENLPFANDSFDLVVANSTIEFVRDQRQVFAECSRMLGEDGAMYINSVNRFSLARDPYAYLWGIGFLPRSLQARYVFWRRGASYENVKTLSYRELNQIAGDYFLTKEFALPDVAPSVLKEFSPTTRWQINAYRFLKKLPPFSLIFKWIGPGWDILLKKNSEQKN